jgi:hypothetical protein
MTFAMVNHTDLEYAAYDKLMVMTSAVTNATNVK